MGVAALYIDPLGPYPKLLGPKMCWDEARDARTYAGPWPVVAHPPCGPWGAWSHLCFKQDRDAFGVALAVVNRWGGVIEHPANSRAFAFHGITPMEEVDQCDFGFRARKRTWLYIRPTGLTLPPLPPKRQPTHTLVNRKYNPGLPGINSRARSITPPAFAEWLVELASQAQAN
jgi:hypothetical protein